MSETKDEGLELSEYDVDDIKRYSDYDGYSHMERADLQTAVVALSRVVLYLLAARDAGKEKP